MEVKLSRGAVAAIWEDPPAVSASGLPLVLQLIDLRPWPAAPGSGWRSMILSDGDHLICGALLPGVAASPVASRMRKGAVVRFPEFNFSVEVRKRLIIPKELEVLQIEWVTIGNPKLYQPKHSEGKHEELNPQSGPSSSVLNTGAYSACQGLKQLLTRGVVVMLQKPVMQVVSVTRSGLGKLEKFHLVLSDGVHTQNATLAFHLNHLVKNNNLRMGTVVRLLDFMCNNTIQSPSMVSVVQLEVLQTECELMGSPKAYHGSLPNYAQPDNASYSSGQNLKWLLTQGAVLAMLEGKMAVEQQPVMQVVAVSRVCKNEFSVYCVLLSDGVYQEHALLFPDMNPLVEGNWLRNGSIVRILLSDCDTRMKYRVFFVSLEVLQLECELIGNPRFHELGLKHKEMLQLYVNLAKIPQLPGHNYFRVLGPPEDVAEWSGQSHPGDKSRPD
ncbi:unnamed protein product [Urochloa decumbens]|uniref:Replication factor-A protein 1 N-terminal domain-containing protein n=1 Tax=Urochloa decumbens TaxID=240449 RepID=A0ABC9BH24_9POAL